MNRKILFRGKRKDNGEWIDGSLLVEYDCSCQIFVPLPKGFGVFIRVDEKTIGQYTGLTDKNGVKIFEGDKTRLGTVEFSFGCWNINGDRELARVFKDIEVLGNIHDNKTATEPAA